MVSDMKTTQNNGEIEYKENEGEEGVRIWRI